VASVKHVVHFSFGLLSVQQNDITSVETILPLVSYGCTTDPLFADLAASVCRTNLPFSSKKIYPHWPKRKFFRPQLAEFIFLEV
jgi:hypothetical protein